MPYKLSNGSWSRFPETKEQAVELRKKKYGGAKRCPDCGTMAGKFVTTDNCMMCQRIKMEHVRWFSTKGLSATPPKNMLHPVSDVDWGKEIFDAVLLVNTGEYYVGEHPCKVHGHVNIVSRRTEECNECSKMLTPLKQAIKDGKEWYIPTQPCSNCHVIAMRGTLTSECSACGHVPTFGPRKRKESHVPATNKDNRETPDTVMMRDNPDMIISKEDAIEYGFKVFRTGQPCLHNHTGWRYVSTGNCIDCLRGK